MSIRAPHVSAGGAECSARAAVARAGQPEAAIERYRRVIEAAPGNADAYNNLDMLLVELGRREEALAVFAEPCGRTTTPAPTTTSRTR